MSPPIQTRIDAFDTVASGAFVAWHARTLAVARSKGIGTTEALAELGAPPEIAAKVKSAAETTTSQPGLAGSSRDVSAFISQAGQNSVLLRMVSDAATFPIPLRTMVHLPDADLTAQIIGEGQPIPVQGFNLNPTWIETFKIAGSFVVTDELLRDTSAAGQAFLNSQMRAAIAKAADEAMFDRLTNSATPVVDADGAIIDVLTAYRHALAGMELRATDRIYTAFGPRIAHWLSAERGLTDGNPLTGSFLGRPAVVVDALDPWEIAIINAGTFVGAVDRLAIDASNQGTVTMTGAVTHNSVTPTGSTAHVSLWQTGSTAIKFQLHLAVEPIRPNGLALVRVDMGSGS